MNGIDNFFANSIISELQQSKILKIPLVKKRLKETHDISLKDAISDFQKFDSILREMVGKKADKIEKKIIESLFSIEKKNNDLWIVTKDPHLTTIALDSFGDPYKRIILEITKIKEQVVFDIVQTSHLPQASGYRRIRELVHEGFLIETGNVSSGDGRNAIVYKNIIEKIIIEINNFTIVKFKFQKDVLTNSYVYRILKK